MSLVSRKIHHIQIDEDWGSVYQPAFGEVIKVHNTVFMDRTFNHFSDEIFDEIEKVRWI
jgi:hypothetical protein